MPRYGALARDSAAALAGFGALSCEIVWTRRLGLVLGNEFAATYGVVAAFFVSLAVGSLLARKRLLRSRRPARWFCIAQLIGAVWTAITPALIAALEPVIIDAGLVARSLAALAVVGPAAACFGLALAALESVARPGARRQSSFSRVYAVHTVGALFGLVFCVAALLPSFGLRATTFLLAGIHVLAAAVAMRTPKPEESTGPPSDRRLSDTVLAGFRSKYSLFLTGFAGIGYEVTAFRVLSQTLENTIYTFAAVLSAYLLGNGLGAFAHSRWAKAKVDRLTIANAITATSLAFAVGAWGLAISPQVYSAVRNITGSTPSGVHAAEWIVAAVALVPPSVAMGWLLSALISERTLGGHPIGNELAVNALGSALGAVFIGGFVLPAAGPWRAIACVTCGYFVTLPIFRRVHVATLATIAVAVVLLPSLRFVDTPDGGKEVDSRFGALATVAVVEWPSERGVHTELLVNNRFRMGGTAARRSNRLHGHFPLLVHPEPRNALFLGVGTGETITSVLPHPRLRAVGVEVLPEVLDLMGHFQAPDPRQNDRLLFYGHDARRYVRASKRPFDVIVGDLFHPARDGAGTLYTREHFSAVKERLEPGGIFCQWLPLYQMGDEVLRSVVATFLSVFSNSRAILLRPSVETPALALIGSVDAIALEPNSVERRLHTVESDLLRRELSALGIAETFRVAACFVAGPKTLGEFSRGAPINTDDRSIVVYAAPRANYVPWEGARKALFELISAERRNSFEGLWVADTPSNKELRERLFRYFYARDRYFEGLLAQRDQDEERAIDRFLESARHSADFELGFKQLILAAQSFHVRDPKTCRSLLETMLEMDQQPGHRAAQQLMNAWFPLPPHPPRTEP